MFLHLKKKMGESTLSEREHFLSFSSAEEQNHSSVFLADRL